MKDRYRTHVLVSDDAWLDDPRLSKTQRQAILDVGAYDTGAVLLGIDWLHRPVVRAMLGFPPRVVTYALQRNGDPTDARWNEDGRLMERWES